MPTSGNRGFLLIVLSKGDELFDTMLRDIALANAACLKRYILTSDSAGRALVEAIS